MDKSISVNLEQFSNIELISVTSSPLKLLIWRLSNFTQFLNIFCINWTLLVLKLFKFNDSTDSHPSNIESTNIKLSVFILSKPFIVVNALSPLNIESIFSIFDVSIFVKSTLIKLSIPANISVNDITLLILKLLNLIDFKDFAFENIFDA